MSAAALPASSPSDVYDLVGIGIGPFNLALAALADAVPALSAVFLDAKPEFSWHPGMLIEGTTLQVPFLADLVTLVDPTSRWSFLSYLRAHERLFPFYFAERFHVPRREYDHYCRWVAQALPSCCFDTRVQSVCFDPAGEVFVVQTDAAPGARGAAPTVRARNVVLGVGTEPVVPEPLRPVLGKEVFHSADYLHAVESLHDASDITVIGSGQSGAEVFADLLRRQHETGWQLRWFTRSPAFAPMEYSKLGLEHFTPDYTRYFHRLPPAIRDELVPSQWQLYKAISAETIAEIHDLLYERGIGGAAPDVTITPNIEVTAAAQVGSGLELSCTHTQQGREFTVQTDRAVLATGYAPRRPDCLQPLAGLLDLDDHGRYRVDERFRVALRRDVSAGLYVQNAEAHTHGVGAPDLGLGAYRAATILNTVVGRSVYPLPDRTAYTTFGAPETGAAHASRSGRPHPRR
ncbi:MAG TPA: SidA/IucD/PvdA family monooxygenase [Pseudonocardiaceae bacterium]|nr:SidA/IucD/PvdA family monooxygenase [Pseudonocardiaceae bacterium]